MGSFSIWHWLIVLVVVLLLFGRGKIPELMGDFAKGIKSFKKGMQDEEKPEEAQQQPAPAPTPVPPPKTIDVRPVETSTVHTEDKSKAS